jgi:hypothetical protein
MSIVPKIERQLREAAERRTDSSVRHVFRRPRAHGARFARPAGIAVAASLLLAGVALAAGVIRLEHGQSLPTQGREIALQAVRETAHLPACLQIGDASSGTVLSEAAPLPAITALLPSLNTPVSSSEQASTLRAFMRARVNAVLLSRTLRTIPVSEHVQLLVAVGVGETGGESVRDPVACAHARLARAERLDRARSASVQGWARWRLAQMRDTVLGLQTLYIYELPVPLPAHKIAGGGTAEPVRPDQPLRPGLPLVSDEPDGARVLIGIATRDASHVRLQTRNTAVMQGLPTVVSIREGFYAVTVPRGVGHFKLLEIAQDGRVLRSVNLQQ